MKTIVIRILSIMYIVSFAACNLINNSSSCVITGQIENLDSNKDMYLHIMDIQRQTIDSIKIINGEFNYTAKIEHPQVCNLMLGKNKIVSFILENANISVHADMQEIRNRKYDNVIIKSDGEQQKLYTEYQRGLQPFLDRDKELSIAWEEFKKTGDVSDPDARRHLDSAYMANLNAKRGYIKKYAENKQNIVALYLLLTELRFAFSVEELNSLINHYPETFNGTKYYYDLLEIIQIKKQLEIGQIAPGFTKPDTSGNPVSLSSFKGKYVLVDFWASWCGPCRAENPWVLKAYNKYHDKGFEVLGVSYDFPGQRAAWIKAIKEDKLPWTNVSDLKGWGDPTAKSYDISGIPSPFLLDPEGRIVAKHNDLRGKKLLEKLANIFDK